MEKQIVDVLDKIEQEITDLPTELVAELRFQHKVLEIIDKYKVGE